MKTLTDYIKENHIDEAIEAFYAYMEGTEELQNIIDAYEQESERN